MEPCIYICKNHSLSRQCDLTDLRMRVCRGYDAMQLRESTISLAPISTALLTTLYLSINNGVVYTRMTLHYLYTGYALTSSSSTSSVEGVGEGDG